MTKYLLALLLLCTLPAWADKPVLSNKFPHINRKPFVTDYIQDGGFHPDEIPNQDKWVIFYDTDTIIKCKCKKLPDFNWYCLNEQQPWKFDDRYEAIPDYRVKDTKGKARKQLIDDLQGSIEYQQSVIKELKNDNAVRMP